MDVDGHFHRGQGDREREGRTLPYVGDDSQLRVGGEPSLKSC